MRSTVPPRIQPLDGGAAEAPPWAWRPVSPAPFETPRSLWRHPAAIPTAGLALAIGFGLLARLPHILGTGFPLNDGGMFYAMVRDLQASHYLIPAHTTYNSESVPFAYPPFAFYLAGLIDTATPASLTEVLRFLPLAANVLTIVVVYFLARALLSERSPVPELAAIIFALLPRGYRWLIMGGGLTRSLGFLFALIAVHETYQLYRQGKRRFLVTASAASALTVLSHPEIAWYLGFSLAAMLICYGRRRAALIDSVWLLAAVGLLTAPWWATVLARHGPAPFLSAAQTGGQAWEVWRSFFSWDFAEISYLNWPAVLAIVGAVILIAQGELFLPVWLVASVTLEPRSGPTYAMVPTAMLAAMAIARIVLPLARRQPAPAAGGAVAVAVAPAIGPPSVIARLREDAPAVTARALPICAVGLFAFYLGFLSVREVLRPDPVLTGLTPQDRSAFQWVEQNTPPGSRFLVVTGNFNPFGDYVSEWFPALTKRQSVATLQGYEWLGEQRYFDQWDRFIALQACRSTSCIESWQTDYDQADYVYVAGDCCGNLEQSLRASYQYTLEYGGPGATVFRRG